MAGVNARRGKEVRELAVDGTGLMGRGAAASWGGLIGKSVSGTGLIRFNFIPADSGTRVDSLLRLGRRRDGFVTAEFVIERILDAA